MAEQSEDSGEGLSVQWSRHWLLEPGTTFLNHGSFGASPKRVLHRQREMREQLERNPVRFFGREYPDMLDRARAELSDFVGAEPAGLAFVSNASSGVNTVLRSRDFDPGDELLVTEQAYPACRNALSHVAEASGAEIVVADVPFPFEDPEELVEAILDATTPRTELALLDHVASPTGLVYPVEQIVEALEERHVDTLVDGAHAPGMLDLEVDAIAPTYYAGNCHKWLCAPKGAGFLWVDEHERDETHPLTISNGYRAETPETTAFRAEFDWTGTRDPTPWLCTPTAIEFLASLVPDGWEGVRRRNRDLALRARELLCDALEADPPMPEECVGAMAAVPLPDDADTEAPDPTERPPLERRLAHEHGIEIPINSWPAAETSYIRASAQLYNSPEQYEELAAILADEVA